LSRLYAFFVFNSLVCFSLYSSVWGLVAAIINAKDKDQNVLDAIQDGQMTKKLMIALCNVAPYWASYLSFRAVSAALDLSQLANFILGWFKRTFLAATPREVIEYSAPPPFDYASYYNYFLFYSTVAIAFAVIQPLVLPVTAFYFAIDAWMKKYLLLYVFTTKNESGGRFWRVLFNRMLFSLLLCDLVVVLIVLAQRGGTGYSWIAMLGVMAPLPLLLIAFKYYTTVTFDPSCTYACKGVTASDLEGADMLDDAKSTRSSTIALRFGHPALFRPLLTPMVHSRAQHLLSQIYEGRLDDEEFDDSVTGTYHNGAYNMKHYRSASKQAQRPKGPFEFVSESDLDFENFKNRSDFRTEFGGEGELYGRPDDAASRAATPVNGQRPGYSRGTTSLSRFGTPSPPPNPTGYETPRYGSPLSRPVDSRDSERTFVTGGQHAPPLMRNYSEERNTSGQNVHLLSHAAPIGREISGNSSIGQEPISRGSTPRDYRMN